MVKKILCAIFAVIFMVSASGCATFVSGRNQNLPVFSTPSGATIYVNGVRYTTPATIMLNRKEEMYQIKIEKEGYESVEVTLRRGVNGWVWGNILFGLFGGIIGLAVDMGTGAINKFTPSEVNAHLVSQKVSLGNKEETMLFVKLTETAR